jgi:SIR2-like domain
MSISPLEPIEDLAKRVLGGSVVFFIGAGFSIDSEGNTADRLIGRLLARLLAMGTCLARESASNHSQARALIEGLGRVFRLPGAPQRAGEMLQPARCMTAANVNALVREYYNFNEWSASALGVLSREMLELAPAVRVRVAESINKLENFLLQSLGSDPVSLEKVNWDALATFRRDSNRGKALFLDTMGFANEMVMGGQPKETDMRRVAQSYAAKLRPRHHALARLAREGLLPYMVTTNYDLLLEGAYRLSGFVEKGSAAAGTDELPETSVPHYSRIAAADQFFSRGDSYHTALLIKIHGCVDAYRDARQKQLKMAPTRQEPGQEQLDSPSQEPWASYLPSLVFTYREIQTWRADAWSRDFLRTLLRTHTLALCGYSGADPVMHSTFREVYEEMAQSRARGVEVHKEGKSADAPVFFFDVAGKREFYSFEILRAATEAGGYPHGKLVEHPNHIEFQIRDGFPSIDDHLRWLYHCVLRTIQERALRTQLRRLAPHLLHHACRDADHQTLCDSFKALRGTERKLVFQAVDRHDAHRVFEGVTGWTWHFLPGLLRELALAELVESRQGPGSSVRGVRRTPWYYPASERQDWTAWAAVLELALRRMVAAWRGRINLPAADLPMDFEWLGAEDSPHAAVSYAPGGSQRQPFALAIRLAGFERPGRAPALSGAFKRVNTWELSEQDVPWRVEEAAGCPSAQSIWDWALGRITDSQKAARHLGVPNER